MCVIDITAVGDTYCAVIEKVNELRLNVNYEK